MPCLASGGCHEEGTGGADARDPSGGECVRAQCGAHGTGQVGRASGPVEARAHRWPTRADRHRDPGFGRPEGALARVLLPARQLAAIHALRRVERPRKYVALTTADTVVVPKGADEDVWAAAIDVIRKPAPPCEGRILHRDFQRGDVLFDVPPSNPEEPPPIPRTHSPAPAWPAPGRPPPSTRTRSPSPMSPWDGSRSGSDPEGRSRSRRRSRSCANNDGDSRAPGNPALPPPGSRAGPLPAEPDRQPGPRVGTRAGTPAACSGCGTPMPDCGDDAGHRPPSGTPDVPHPVAMHDIGWSPMSACSRHGRSGRERRCPSERSAPGRVGCVGRTSTGSRNVDEHLAVDSRPAPPCPDLGGSPCGRPRRTRTYSLSLDAG